MTSRSEEIGNVLQDGVELFLNALVAKTAFTIKKTSKKSGEADFHLVDPNDGILASIEVKNHKRDSFWLNSQGYAYSGKFIGLGADVVKVIVYTGCELRDRVRAIFAEAGIVLYDVGKQVRTPEDMRKAYRRLMGLGKFLKRAVIRSSTLRSSGRSIGALQPAVRRFGGSLRRFLHLLLRSVPTHRMNASHLLSTTIKSSRFVGPFLEALTFIDDVVLGGAASLTSSLGMLLVTILLLSALKALGEM